MGVRLFVGSNAWRIRGEPATLTGDRCFTAAHRPPRLEWDADKVTALLDSGAFTDPPERQRTPAEALDRQLAWERSASAAWGQPWQAAALASYDLLIDELWADGQRVKRRWSEADAERAVDATVTAAGYLSGQRAHLTPRRLVLGVQGVTADQYVRCTRQVLAHAAPEDWIGLGGWCILGRWQTWLPVFLATMRRILPAIAAAGVGHVHLYGVLWEPATAGLLYLADRHGLTVSTDSAAPMLAATYANPHKAGMRDPAGWRQNVAWWRAHLAGLRTSPHYRPPTPELLGRPLALAGGM